LLIPKDLIWRKSHPPGFEKRGGKVLIPKGLTFFRAPKRRQRHEKTIDSDEWRVFEKRKNCFGLKDVTPLVLQKEAAKY